MAIGKLNHNADGAARLPEAAIAETRSAMAMAQVSSTYGFQ